jgi:hypothetical protein
MTTLTEQVDVRMTPDGRMRAREAARYLGMASKTMAVWRTRGESPPFIKLGRIFYYKADLDA